VGFEPAKVIVLQGIEVFGSQVGQVFEHLKRCCTRIIITRAVPGSLESKTCLRD